MRHLLHTTDEQIYNVHVQTDQYNTKSGKTAHKAAGVLTKPVAPMQCRDYSAVLYCEYLGRGAPGGKAANVLSDDDRIYGRLSL